MSTEFRTAIRDAIALELEADERVLFFGEDVAAAGGVFKATPGLMERFGTGRVFDTPISELALAGAAFGAAIAGKRPTIRKYESGQTNAGSCAPHVEWMQGPRPRRLRQSLA